MRITVLMVPDCPNAPLARQRITDALAGRDAVVETVAVHDEAQATAHGMTGSPTILLDGTDPFAPEGAAPSVSCRLYRSTDGTAASAPSVTDLRRALTAAGLPEASENVCCDGDLLDPIGRGGRGRKAPAERGLRAVHQAVLRHFAATGATPTPEDLEEIAATHGRSAPEVLAELAREDFLTLDETGSIRAAYPFSAVPTRHRVRIGEVEVWSMCAIDALGIPAMIGRDVVITSVDPVNSAIVTVTTGGGGGEMTWEPSNAVVFVGRRPGNGPAASLCCDTLNFFTDVATAQAWVDEHPDVPGQIVTRTCAERIAADTFGPLLAA